jgi:hypothetical protein
VPRGGIEPPTPFSRERSHHINNLTLQKLCSRLMRGDERGTLPSSGTRCCDASTRQPRNRASPYPRMMRNDLRRSVGAERDAQSYLECVIWYIQAREGQLLSVVCGSPSPSTAS